jgi:hypothetical protein
MEFTQQVIVPKKVECSVEEFVDQHLADLRIRNVNGEDCYDIFVNSRVNSGYMERVLTVPKRFFKMKIWDDDGIYNKIVVIDAIQDYLGEKDG